MTLAPLEEHQLSKIKLVELKFDETNPNELSAEQMEALRKSMKKFGYLTPIIVDQNNMIADGEHRALIYKEFGFSEIPCFKVSLKDDIERRMLRQVMNKLHGEHDRQRDANELLQIFESKQLDELAQLIAQPREGLENILTKYHGIEFQHEDNFNPETLEELNPVTQLGDIWQLGQHRIICADNSDKKSLHKLINDKEIELLFTDPPYNVGFEFNDYVDTKTDEEYADFTRKWYEQVKGVKKIIITPGPRNISLWTNVIGRPKDIGTWYKPNSTSGASCFKLRTCEPLLFYGEYEHQTRRLTDFFEYSRSIMNEKREAEQAAGVADRPAPGKPIQLLADLFQSYTHEGQIILDIFLGSGSTLMACEQTKRICYGVEIDPHYVDVCVKRWETFTNNKAVKL